MECRTLSFPKAAIRRTVDYRIYPGVVKVAGLWIERPISGEIGYGRKIAAGRLTRSLSSSVGSRPSSCSNCREMLSTWALLRKRNVVQPTVASEASPTAKNGTSATNVDVHATFVEQNASLRRGSTRLSNAVASKLQASNGGRSNRYNRRDKHLLPLDFPILWAQIPAPTTIVS